MREKRVFGELELAILKLFDSQKRLTVKGVLEALGGSDKYTTIMTVMNRLVEKHELMRERMGQQYEYWASDSVRTPQRGFLEKLKFKLFGGKSLSMISYLIESGEDLTDNDLDEMEKLIEQAKHRRAGRKE